MALASDDKRDEVHIHRIKKPLLIGATTLIVASIAAASALMILGRNRVYRGPTIEPNVWIPQTDCARIVEEARKLIGLWYDPAQGYLKDIGGKLGLIVVSAVV